MTGRAASGDNRFTRRLRAIDRYQQRHRALGVPYAVNKRFGEHDGSRVAATVSYYSFFSVFPLLLALVTVLDLVVSNNDQLRQELLDGAVGQIPVIGSQLAADQEALPGSGWVLVFGLATAIWAGLGAVDALQHGLDVLGDVPIHARGNMAVKRLRGLAFLALFAVTLVLSTLLANVSTLFDAGWIAGGLGLLATFVVNAALLVVMFTVLPARRRPLRELLPGVVAGAVGLVVLQQIGSYVVRRFIAGASDTYGTFAIVIALLSWFHLVSRIVMLAAELNGVVADGLSPRRLVAGDPPTDADRRAIMLDVQRVQRDPRLGYAVALDGHVATDDDPLAERDATDHGADHEVVARV